MRHYEDIETMYRRPEPPRPVKPTKKSRTPPSIMPRETDIVRSILDGLHTCGVLAWRVNTGGMTGSHNGKSRFVRFGLKGQADIQGIWHGGRFLAIEVKRPGGKPSEEQLNWLHRVSAAGGIAFIAHSWTEVEQRLWGKGMP